MLDCFCCLRVRISACLRKIGCRCVLDESQKAWEPAGVQGTTKNFRGGIRPDCVSCPIPVRNTSCFERDKRDITNR